MDGLLIVDKPSGPTSHDVVARVRRALREPRIGHTGTLDPLASGVLPLVVGKATRLARFLSGDKAYEASVRLGVATDTYDALGRPAGTPHPGPWPDAAVVARAIEAFVGTHLQQPPAFSAKKIAGRRSYRLARQAGPAVEETAPPILPAPVSVTAYAIDLIAADADAVRLMVRCSAGFYVRSLVHDLGASLGTGAHLTGLRRIEACGASLDQAVDPAAIEADPALAGRTLVTMADMLADLAAVVLTPDGVAKVRVGRDLEPSDAASGFVTAAAAVAADAARPVRLLDPGGNLVAVAEASPVAGLLHPAVVLM